MFVASESASATDVRLPWLLAALAGMPWPIKRRLATRPLAWRSLAGLCRLAGWDDRWLGWHRVANGPFGGLRIEALHPNHLWAPLGTYEPAVAECLAGLLRSMQGAGTPVEVWDVGANHGLMALLCAHRGAARVLAVEPWPPNVTTIRAHLDANPGPAGRIEILQAAISNADGDVTLVADARDGQICQIEAPGIEAYARASPTTARVHARSLDSLVAERRVAPAIVKIDVEGAEALVLDGARGLLEAHRPYLVVELHDRGAAARALQVLAEVRYDCRRIAAGGHLVPVAAGMAHVHVLATPRP